MKRRWWGPGTSLEEAQADLPGWATFDPTYVACPYCQGSTRCPKCNDGCYECDFEGKRRLCNGRGDVPDPD